MENNSTLERLRERVTQLQDDLKLAHAREARLRNEENTYRLLTETMADVVFVLNMNLEYLYVSPSVERQRGYRPEELIGKSAFQFLHHSCRERIKKIAHSWRTEQSGSEPALTGTKELLLRHIHKNGKEIWTEVNITLARDKSGIPYAIHGVSRDVNERVEAKQHLERSEERFREMVNMLPTVVCELDLKGNFTFVNEMGLSLFGYSREDLEHGVNVFDVIDPSHQKMFKKRSAALLAGETTSPVTYKMVKKSGESLSVQLRSSLISHKGQPQGYRTTLTDITSSISQKETIASLERQILRAQRLESIGLVAGGLAHDFNNLLVPIMGNADLLLLELPCQEKSHEHAKKIKTAAVRASELTNQMLTYTGRAPGSVSTSDLNEIVREMGGLLT